MDKLQELLTITMEECGELIQECSKSIRKNHRQKILTKLFIQYFSIYGTE